MLKTSQFKNLSLKTLFLSVFAVLFTFNLHATKALTFDPTKWLLSEKQESTAKFKKFLDTFFTDPMVAKFFIEQEKPAQFDHVQVRALQQKANPQLLEWATRKQQRIQFQQSSCNYGLLLKKIYEKYDITDLGTRSHTFILRFKAFPQFVVKLPKADWPLKFQNISRFFYDKNIRTFVKENKIEHLKPVGKCLYLFPQPSQMLKELGLDETMVPLDDTYFAVIAKYIPNLSANDEFRFKNITNLVKQEKFTNLITGQTTTHLVSAEKGTDQILVDLLKVITSGVGGAWDIKANLFYNPETKIWTLVDTEESGLDAWRCDPKIWTRNAHCFERFGLGDMLSKDGKKEKARKIENEMNCGLNQLHEIFAVLEK